MKCFYDTETCGLVGPIVLIQYAFDDEPTQLHYVFATPIRETMDLIEKMMDCEVIGFNLAFDHFHICQTYTVLDLLGSIVGYDQLPEDHINAYANCEPKARDGKCLRPKAALDLMLHARKGPYQSTMNRGDIRVRKIPTVLCKEVANYLTEKIPLKDIYFKGKDRWKVRDITDENDDIIPDFKDLVLSFSPSSALKALATDALGVDTVRFGELPSPKPPVEKAYAPFALSVGNAQNWNGAWPDLGQIRIHIDFWTFNETAIKYAIDDVVFTRGLYHFFDAKVRNYSDADAREYSREGVAHTFDLSCGDVDSELSCMVGAVRWRGYKVDLERCKRIKKSCEALINDSPYNFNSTAVVKKYMLQVLTEMEKSQLITPDGQLSTKAVYLEAISKWREADICEGCEGMGCATCDQEGMIKTDVPHPAALRAQEVLAFRGAAKQVDQLSKLIEARRFHAEFKVIGTLSSRMAGGGEDDTKGGSLNPQGIIHAKEIRKCFNLAFPGSSLCAGDFSGFELSIMDAAYPDERLHAEMTSNQKVHGLWGSRYFFPGLSYEEILATDGLPGEKDKYTRSKNGVFAIAYFGEAYTLTNRVGIPEEIAEAAYQNIQNDYPDFSEGRKTVIDRFCSMKQPEGIGTPVTWAEPDDYIESLLGFKRYFTLENKICKALFHMAENPPEEWKRLKGRIVRRDREQTFVGACRSALFAAAFAIQGSNMRAAGNHRIQSTGGELCKRLQCRLWDLQPPGVGDWIIQPMNVHDEILAPTVDRLKDRTTEIVKDFVKENRKLIPLLDISWKTNIANWSEK